MSEVYVVGHRNPDTDSICSAIAYADLKRKLTGNKYKAKRAGQVNSETKFVLQHFGVNPPGYLPKAENFSLYSTCKGMKSTPGFASLAAVTVANIMVLPIRRTTAPSACFANFPVSSVIVRPSANTMLLTIGLIINFLLFYLYLKYLTKLSIYFYFNVLLRNKL